MRAYHVARLHAELTDLGTGPRILVCCGGTVSKHVHEHWPDPQDRVETIRHYSYTRDNPGKPRSSQPEVYVADVRRSLAAVGLGVPGV